MTTFIKFVPRFDEIWLIPADVWPRFLEFQAKGVQPETLADIIIRHGRVIKNRHGLCDAAHTQGT